MQPTVLLAGAAACALFSSAAAAQTGSAGGDNSGIETVVVTARHLNEARSCIKAPTAT